MSQRAEVEAGVDDADLTGKTALATGATSGVGREVALALGRLGARVVVHGRNEARGRTVADDLDALGAEPVFLMADFADPDAPTALPQPSPSALTNSTSSCTRPVRTSSSRRSRTTTTVSNGRSP